MKKHILNNEIAIRNTISCAELHELGNAIAFLNTMLASPDATPDEDEQTIAEVALAITYTYERGVLGEILYNNVLGVIEQWPQVFTAAMVDNAYDFAVEIAMEINNERLESNDHVPNNVYWLPDPEYIRSLITRSNLPLSVAARRVGINERAMRSYVASRQSSTAANAPYAVQFALEMLVHKEIWNMEE
jgi:hypothetical protein